MAQNIQTVDHLIRARGAVPDQLAEEPTLYQKQFHCTISTAVTGKMDAPLKLEVGTGLLPMRGKVIAIKVWKEDFDSCFMFAVEVHVAIHNKVYRICSLFIETGLYHLCMVTSSHEICLIRMIHILEYVLIKQTHALQLRCQQCQQKIYC